MARVKDFEQHLPQIWQKLVKPEWFWWISFRCCLVFSRITTGDEMGRGWLFSSTNCRGRIDPVSVSSKPLCLMLFENRPFSCGQVPLQIEVRNSEINATQTRLCIHRPGITEAKQSKAVLLSWPNCEIQNVLQQLRCPNKGSQTISAEATV